MESADLTNALAAVATAGWALAAALGDLLVTFVSQYWAILAWTAYWLWFARWPDLRGPLRRGAWLSLALLSAIFASIWGLLSEPSLGLAGVPSVLEKMTITATWIGLAFICGSIQDRLGWSPPELEIAGPPEGAAPADAGHGHVGRH